MQQSGEHRGGGEACVSCVPALMAGCGGHNTEYYRPQHHPLAARAKLAQGQLQVMETPQGLKVHTEEPHLVSLGGGRLSTSVTLFPIPPGRTRIGTAHATRPQDVVIQGPGVHSQHCYLINEGGDVTLYPLAELCSVDGQQINLPTPLTQGCMLCLGRSNFFRFNHPEAAQKLRDNGPLSPPGVSVRGQPDDHGDLYDSGVLHHDRFRDSLEDAKFAQKLSRFEFLTQLNTSDSIPEPRSPHSPRSPSSAVPRSPVGGVSLESKVVLNNKREDIVGRSQAGSCGSKSPERSNLLGAAPNTPSADSKKVNFSVELDIHANKAPEKTSGEIHILRSKDIQNSPPGASSQSSPKWQLTPQRSYKSGAQDKLNKVNNLQSSDQSSSSKIKVIKSSSPSEGTPSSVVNVSSSQNQLSQSAPSSGYKTQTFLSSPPRNVSTGSERRLTVKKQKSADSATSGQNSNLPSLYADSPLKALLLSRSLSVENSSSSSVNCSGLSEGPDRSREKLVSKVTTTGSGKELDRIAGSRPVDTSVITTVSTPQSTVSTTPTRTPQSSSEVNTSSNNISSRVPAVRAENQWSISSASTDSGRGYQSDTSSRESAKLILRSGSPKPIAVKKAKGESGFNPLSSLPPPVPPKSKRNKARASHDNPWRVNLKHQLKPSLDQFKGEKVFTKDVVTTNVVVAGFDSGHVKTEKAHHSQESNSSGYLSDSAVLTKPSRDKKKGLATSAYCSELDKEVRSADELDFDSDDDEPLYAQVPDADSLSSDSGGVPSADSLDDELDTKTSPSEASKADMALSSGSPRSPQSPHITLGTRGLPRSPPPSESEQTLDNNANFSVCLDTMDNNLTQQLDHLSVREQSGSSEVNRSPDSSDSTSSSSGTTQSLNIDELNVDELTESQRGLKDLHDRMREERKKEQEMASLEQQRLEDILNMCAEYEKQLEREQAEKQEHTKSPTQYKRNSMTKIKTNGSLGKLGSPTSGHREIPVFDYSKGHRNSSSSTSEEEGSENGTIKRRPGTERGAYLNSSPHTSSPHPSPRSNSPPSRNRSTSNHLPSSPRHNTRHLNDSLSGSSVSGPRSPLLSDSVSGPRSPLLSDSVSGPRSPLLSDSVSGPRSPLLSDSVSGPRSPLLSDSVSGPRSPLLSDSVSGPRLPLLSDSVSGPRSPLLSDSISPHGSDNVGRTGQNHEAHFNGLNGDGIQLTPELSPLEQKRQDKLQSITLVKQHISEVETQKNEAMRELEMERALLDGEHQNVSLALQDTQDKLQEVQDKLRDVQSHQESMQAASSHHQLEIARLHAEMEEMEAQGEFLLHQMKLTASAADRQKIADQLQMQQEQLDVHRKMYDDLEFEQLEVETRFEEEREEVQQSLVIEHTALQDKTAQLQARLDEIEAQQRAMLSQARLDLSQLESRKHQLVDHMRQEKCELADCTRQIHVLTPPPVPPHSHAYQMDRKTYAAATDEYTKDGPAVSRTQPDTSQSMHPPAEKERLAGGRPNASGEAQWNVNGSLPRHRGISFQSLESEDSSDISSNTPSDKEVSLSSGDDHLAKLTEMERSLAVDAGSLQRTAHGAMSGHVALRELEQERQRRVELEQQLRQEVAHRQQLVEEEVQLRHKRKAQSRPLTCYLPMRNTDLDLRHFIETSGHNVDGCPHVHLDATSCRGFLTKMGTKLKRWNKRWFVFDRSRKVLLYYPDKSETKPRGAVYFQSIQDVFVDHLRTVKSPNPKLTLCVKTYDRTYYLVAPSAEAMRIWINAIFTGAEGYQEYS